jgi:hypothetical protein
MRLHRFCAEFYAIDEKLESSFLQEALKVLTELLTRLGIEKSYPTWNFLFSRSTQSFSLLDITYNRIFSSSHTKWYLCFAKCCV